MVKQLAWLRRLPVDEAIWNEIRDLMNLQKSVQLGGAETRKKAIRYLLGRRRYEFWHRMGRLDQEETMGESVLPDEWAAVHYGWGHSTADEQPRDPGDYGDEESWSPTDHGEEADQERPVTPPMVTENDAGAPRSTAEVPTFAPTTTGESGGKVGGKGAKSARIQRPAS